MQTANKKPDFFILGAPKCGTTALSVYLGEHPDIFFSEPKEPNYFTDHARNLRQFTSDKDYLHTCFARAADHKIAGEGTTRYLRSPEAVPRILAFQPHAKFIVMLRNPTEMFESLFWQRVYEGKEFSKTPAEAWEKHKVIDAKQPRQAGDTDAGELRYGEICRTGEQLERLYTQADPSRVHVIFYDDFKHDPNTSYQQTLAFLGIPDDGRKEFSVIHRRKTARSPLVRTLIKKAGKLKKMLGIKRSLRANPLVQRIIGGAPPMSKKLKKELVTYFTNDIERLEALTSRNLSVWKQVLS